MDTPLYLSPPLDVSHRREPELRVHQLERIRYQGSGVGCDRALCGDLVQRKPAERQS